LVSRAELLDLVEQARGVLPARLGRADELLADAGAVRSQAEEQAAELLEEARRQAAELVSAEAVVVEARAEAERIVAEARRAADRLRADADDYCDRRLAELEIDLEAVLTQVHSGRSALA